MDMMALSVHISVVPLQASARIRAFYTGPAHMSAGCIPPAFLIPADFIQ